MNDRAPAGGEGEFVARLAAHLPGPPPGQTWIGDDAAVLADGRLLCTDLLGDGVHFRLADTTPADVGAKALVVNLSDVAAMGGTPEAAVVAVSLPRDRPGLADGLMDGLAAAADRWACPLVGGDTTAGPTLVVAVTVLGRAPATGAVLRSGGREGQTLFLTGPIGGAGAALDALARSERPDPDAAGRLHRPTPRLAAGAAAARAGATAMIDLSDGLGLDVDRLCRSSGVGVLVDGDALPVASGVALDRAVQGGDDYELCFAADDPRRVRATFAEDGLDAPVAVGRLLADRAARILRADGRDRELPAAGWQHPVP